MRHNKVIYPKVYATIISYTIHGQRIGQSTKSFTPEEWMIVSRRPGKRRCYFKDHILKVKLDSGEELVLFKHQAAYAGKRRCLLLPGHRIKMYHHPRDTREWRYKFLGE